MFPLLYIALAAIRYTKCLYIAAVLCLRFSLINAKVCFVVQKSLAFVLLLFEPLFGLTSSIEASNLTRSQPMLRSSVKSKKRQCYVRTTSEYRSEA